MVKVDFYDHSVTTAIAETHQSDPLSAEGERGGCCVATAALPPWQLRCHMGEVDRVKGVLVSKSLGGWVLEGECPSVSLPTIKIQLECRSNRSPKGILGDLETCSAIKPFFYYFS